MSVGSRREAMSSISADQFVGEDLSGCGGAAGDLVEQRSRRAAVGALVAVLGREVGADERLESRPICGLGVEALALGAQLVGEDVRHKILLGGEVGIEGAVGQAGVGHNGRHAGAIDAVLLEAPPGRFEDALSAWPASGPCRIASRTSLVELVSIMPWALPRGV